LRFIVQQAQRPATPSPEDLPPGVYGVRRQSAAATAPWLGQRE